MDAIAVASSRALSTGSKANHDDAASHATTRASLARLERDAHA
jgi:hypothetical protein